MKKTTTAFILIVSMHTLDVGLKAAKADDVTLDTRTQTLKNASIDRMRDALSASDQQNLLSALAVIYTAAATRSMVDDVDIYQMKRQLNAKLHGMTAEDIINFAQTIEGK